MSPTARLKSESARAGTGVVGPGFAVPLAPTGAALLALDAVPEPVTTASGAGALDAAGATESRSDLAGAPLHAASVSAAQATTIALVGRNNNILHQFSFSIARGLQLRE